MLTNYKRTWNRQYYQTPRKRSNLNFSTASLKSCSDTLTFNEQVILRHTYFIQQSIIFNSILLVTNNIRQQLIFVENHSVNIIRQFIITDSLIFSNYLSRYFDDDYFRSKPWLTLTRPDPVNEL